MLPKQKYLARMALISRGLRREGGGRLASFLFAAMGPYSSSAQCSNCFEGACWRCSQCQCWRWHAGPRGQCAHPYINLCLWRQHRASSLIA